MEYSIQALSRLSGVTTRTLRWYDQIGLLKPSRVADSGYRYYGPAEVDRLQDIMFYRALGVELARIRSCLDDPSFDRLEALRSHLAALEAKQEETLALIRAVKETIRTQERNEYMNDEEKFRAFKAGKVAENEKTYGKEARERYGDDAVDRSNQAVMGMNQEQYRELEELNQAILDQLAAAVLEGADPAGEKGKALCELHRRWLTLTWGRYDPEHHKGVAQLYTQDPRFTAYYDEKVAGCAQFLSDAVTCWAGGQ